MILDSWYLRPLPYLPEIYQSPVNGDENGRIGDCAELLMGYALLAEGSELPDPVRFNNLVVQAMLQSI